jgi:hypothetical protein
MGELSDELIGRFLQEYIHHPSKSNLYYFSARSSLGMFTVKSAGVFSINSVLCINGSIVQAQSMLLLIEHNYKTA